MLGERSASATTAAVSASPARCDDTTSPALVSSCANASVPTPARIRVRHRRQAAGGRRADAGESVPSASGPRVGRVLTDGEDTVRTGRRQAAAEGRKRTGVGDREADRIRSGRPRPCRGCPRELLRVCDVVLPRCDRGATNPVSQLARLLDCLALSQLDVEGRGPAEAILAAVLASSRRAAEMNIRPPCKHASAHSLSE